MEAQQCVELTGTNSPRACLLTSLASTVRFPRFGREPEPHRLDRLTSPYRFGGHGERETPGSIPNPEAKPLSADGTARVTAWESRTPPDILSTRATFGWPVLFPTHGRLSTWLNDHRHHDGTPAGVLARPVVRRSLVLGSQRVRVDRRSLVLGSLRVRVVRRSQVPVHLHLLGVRERRDHEHRTLRVSRVVRASPRKRILTTSTRVLRMSCAPCPRTCASA